MERILHYVWRHKMFPLKGLRTRDGKPVEVFSPGIANSDAGPDFLGAKVKIDGILWVGNVEIHIRNSDWFRHRHDKDRNYDNIILHVSTELDTNIFYKSGENVPQIQIDIPEQLVCDFDRLTHSDDYPPCKDVISHIPTLITHNWLAKLLTERLEQKNRQITGYFNTLDGDWENVMFVCLARSFGFGKNGDAFEEWAKGLSLKSAAKHRDSLFQVKALFFGRAGMLDRTGIHGVKDDDYARLCDEYEYLSHKFSLSHMERHKWKYLRLRPVNFPHVRISQLAELFHEEKLNFSRIIEGKSKDEFFRMLEVDSRSFVLSENSKESILINAIIPLIFSYGCYRDEQQMKDKAFELYEQTKVEDNKVTRDWKNAGIKPEHGGDSQGLIQLHNNYCFNHDCLRCVFGHEYMSNNTKWLM